MPFTRPRWQRVAGTTELRASGPQYHPNYYGAFVFDPDGINIEAVCHRPSEVEDCLPAAWLLTYCKSCYAA